MFFDLRLAILVLLIISITVGIVGFTISYILYKLYNNDTEYISELLYINKIVNSR